MNNYTKLLQKREREKENYVTKLNSKKCKKTELLDELKELYTIIDDINNLIIKCSNKLTELEDAETAIDEIKENFKTDLKIALFANALAIGAAVLLANVFSNLAMTIFIFYGTSFTVASLTLPLLKYPFIFKKNYKIIKNYKKSEIEVSQENYKNELINLILETKQKEKEINKIDEVIKSLENIISKLEDEIFRIANAKELVSKKLGEDATELDYNKKYEQDKVVKNILRLERERKHDN